MKRVLTAVVLVPLVLLVVFRAPLWLFLLAIVAVTALAVHEYLGIARASGLAPFKLLTWAGCMLPFLLLWLNGLPVDTEIRKVSACLFFLGGLQEVLMLAAIALGIALVFRQDMRGGLASAAASAFGVLYIAVPFSLLFCLRADTELLVLFVLFSVWAGDVAAYYVGRSIGRHKLAPIVSPNKSWEGAIASVIASVAVAFLVLHFRAQLTLWFSPGGFWNPESGTFYRSLGTVSPLHALGLGVLTNVAAQFGDLFESALKRGANLKDSGTLLPGHGGILDRIDALLFAIPVVWYYASLTGFLQQTQP